MSLRVRLIESPGGMDGASQFLMSYVVQDFLAIDAGSLGFFGTPEQQARIRHIFISHSHTDHIATLPMFLENTRYYSNEPCTIYGNEAVLECLERDVFNDCVAPRELVNGSSGMTVRFQAVRPLEEIRIEGLVVTPVEMNHVVPTLGFMLSNHTSAAIIASDTGPTQQLWQVAHRAANLRAVFLEATFPDDMLWLAEVSKHLTPALFREEIRKLPEGSRVIAVHIKARFFERVLRELMDLDVPNLAIGEPGKEYSF